MVVDEKGIDDFLNPKASGALGGAKSKYENFMSEFNIKRKVGLVKKRDLQLKGYDQQSVMKELPSMMMKLEEFFVKDEMENASSILIPPLLKELKESHPPRFSIRDLQPFHKDLRFVGYGLSYLDKKPEVLQTRVIKTKGAMYAQLTVGVRTVEVRHW